jgi:hypothetical protein
MPRRQDARSGVQFVVGEIDFLFSSMCRPAVGSNLSPVQWVPGALSQWEKWLGSEVTLPPLLNTEAKNEWNCTSPPPVCVYGVNMDRFSL